jgi:hypothetical protein
LAYAMERGSGMESISREREVPMTQEPSRIHPAVDDERPDPDYQ